MTRFVLLALLILSSASLAQIDDERAGGCRVNSNLVFYTTGEFVQFLGECEESSIRLLEFSGDGSRLHQSLDEYFGGHLENVLRLEKDGRWSFTDKSGREPDPEWSIKLKRALDPQAVVYFYGCQTGWYDHTGLVIPEMAEGIARKFSEDFEVATVACPEFVFYPGLFPDFGGQFFSNPTEPPSKGFSTQGGLWNVFRNGVRYPPLNRAWTTSVQGLPAPRMPKTRE